MKSIFLFFMYFTFVYEVKSMNEICATIIIDLKSNQEIFFYKQTKFIYPTKGHYYYFKSKLLAKKDTILFTDILPNVLIFQENNSGMIPIIIFPNDTITITIQIDGKLNFEGNKSVEWNMMPLLTKEQSFTEPCLYNRTFKDINIMEEELISISNKRMILINQYQLNNRLSDEYVNYLKKENEYQLLASWFSQKNKSFKNAPIPIKKMNQKKSILSDSLNMGSMYRHPALYGFVQAECNCVENVFPSQNEFVVLYNFVKEKYEGINQFQLLLSILYEQIKITSNYNLDIDFYKPYLDDFYSRCNDLEYVNFVKDLTGLKSASSLSLDSVKILTTKGVINTLKSVNLNSKDKFFYIDFWASWCLPCIAEMPSSEKLRMDYQNKGVSFIYLSIDKNIELWQRALKRIKINETKNFILPDYINQYIVRQLSIEEIPRYVLIDQYGNIIEYNAPRPSEPKIRKIFDKVLNQ